METGTKVVVSTKHRGVFYGTLVDRKSGEVVLSGARMCVYWCAKTKGFIGLASKGPGEGCRITDAAPSLEVVDVTAVVECSEEASKAWEAAPWS